MDRFLHGERRCLEHDAGGGQRRIEFGCERHPDAECGEHRLAAPEEAARLAAVDDPAGGIHHHHPVDQPDHAVEAMIDENDAAGGGRGCHQESAQPRGGSRREVGRGLVDYQQGSMPGQQGGKRHDLLFTARQHHGAAAPLLAREADAVEGGLHPTVDLGERQALILEREGNLVRNRHSAQRLLRILKELGHARSPLRRVPRAHLVPEQGDGAGNLGKHGLRYEARQRLQEGGLARSGGPEQQQPLARKNGQGRRPGRGLRPIRIANRDVLPGGDRSRGVTHGLRASRDRCAGRTARRYDRGHG